MLTCVHYRRHYSLRRSLSCVLGSCPLLVRKIQKNAIKSYTNYADSGDEHVQQSPPDVRWPLVDEPREKLRKTCLVGCSVGWLVMDLDCKPINHETKKQSLWADVHFITFGDLTILARKLYQDLLCWYWCYAITSLDRNVFDPFGMFTDFYVSIRCMSVWMSDLCLGLNILSVFYSHSSKKTRPYNISVIERFVIQRISPNLFCEQLVTFSNHANIEWLSNYYKDDISCSKWLVKDYKIRQRFLVKIKTYHPMNQTNREIKLSQSYHRESTTLKSHHHRAGVGHGWQKSLSSERVSVGMGWWRWVVDGCEIMRELLTTQRITALV